MEFKNLLENDIITLIVECSSIKSQLRNQEQESYNKTKKILLKIIEILDAFERVLDNIEPKLENTEKRTKIWIGNFKSIKRSIERTLKSFNVVPIEAPEGKAIPGFHTIIETKKVSGLEDNTIIEIIEKGYLWQGKILRKSSVIVAKN